MESSMKGVLVGRDAGRAALGLLHSDGSSLDDDFGALGGWIAATLVCVGDVALAEN